MAKKSFLADVFDFNNVVITLRAVLSGLLTMIVMAIFIVIANKVYGLMPTIGLILYIVIVFVYAFVWGWMFRKIKIGKIS